MSETSGRLLRLLSLLQTPREWPGPELARRLGVTQRTVRNDVERLRQLGYPVLASRGSVGGYRLSAGTAMPPLLLDDEEAVDVAVRSTASCSRCWPRLPGTGRSSGSPTPTTAAPPPSDASSPTASSTGDCGGISSPSTSSATTGARS